MCQLGWGHSMIKILSGLVFAFCLLAKSAAAQPPNIVLIIADDLGREDCGFMGGKVIKTPCLDALAAKGAILDAHYVQPVCSPTRAALMTGRYPMRHGLQVGVVRPWAQYGLPLGETTLAEVLQRKGYQTAIVGKWHLGHFQPAYLPTKRGFHHQYGHYNGAIDYNSHIRDGGFDWHKDDKVCHDEGYSTHLLASAAVQFIDKTAGKSPFFLYVPFNAVHAPHQVPDSYKEPYKTLKGNRKTYAGMLAAMDEAVGKIVAAVEKAGQTKNTLFVFSSDNGGPSPGTVTNNGSFRAGKGTVYEGGVRVAAFATWPGKIAPGLTVKAPIHAVDWFPTMAHLAGGAVPTPGLGAGESDRRLLLPLDGINIWPVLTEGKPTPHKSILLQTSPSVGALRMGDWKLVVHHGVKDPGEIGTDFVEPKPMELFNLVVDPFEKTNLAATEIDRLKSMRLVLDQYASQAVAPKIRPKPRGFVTPKVWGEN